MPETMADSRTFPKSGVTCCDETHCRCEVFGTHFGLEVGHGFSFSSVISGAPFCKETDGETAKHSQDPDRVTIADSGIVLVRGGIESLMQASLNAPVLASGGKPLLRVHLIRGTVRDQVHRFGFVRADAAMEPGNLLDVRETREFSRCRLSMNLALFRSRAIDLVGPGKCRRHGGRGERPPREWRRSVSGSFA